MKEQKQKIWTMDIPLNENETDKHDHDHSNHGITLLEVGVLFYIYKLEFSL